MHKCLRIKYYLQPSSGMYGWRGHASSDMVYLSEVPLLWGRMECVAETALEEPFIAK